VASLASIFAHLRKLALAYPGAVEEFPWGDRVFKVKGKIFACLDEGSITVKLPHSGPMALLLPFCRPTPYNLGKSGWVSASFERAKDVPVDMLVEWIDESYRAIAPARLSASLAPREPRTRPPAPAPSPAPAPRARRSPRPAGKAAGRRAAGGRRPRRS
jgi:predicted DNA-binding protein (MmcQ/YjbR family)